MAEKQGSSGKTENDFKNLLDTMPPGQGKAGNYTIHKSNTENQSVGIGTKGSWFYSAKRKAITNQDIYDKVLASFLGGEEKEGSDKKDQTSDGQPKQGQEGQVDPIAQLQINLQGKVDELLDKYIAPFIGKVEGVSPEAIAQFRENLVAAINLECKNKSPGGDPIQVETLRLKCSVDILRGGKKKKGEEGGTEQGIKRQSIVGRILEQGKFDYDIVYKGGIRAATNAEKMKFLKKAIDLVNNPTKEKVQDSLTRNLSQANPKIFFELEDDVFIILREKDTLFSAIQEASDSIGQEIQVRPSGGGGDFQMFGKISEEVYTTILKIQKDLGTIPPEGRRAFIESQLNPLIKKIKDNCEEVLKKIDDGLDEQVLATDSASINLMSYLDSILEDPGDAKMRALIKGHLVAMDMFFGGSSPDLTFHAGPKNQKEDLVSIVSDPKKVEALSGTGRFKEMEVGDFCKAYKDLIDNCDSSLKKAGYSDPKQRILVCGISTKASVTETSESSFKLGDITGNNEIVSELIADADERVGALRAALEKGVLHLKNHKLNVVSVIEEICEKNGLEEVSDFVEEYKKDPSPKNAEDILRSIKSRIVLNNLKNNPEILKELIKFGLKGEFRGDSGRAGVFDICFFYNSGDTLTSDRRKLEGRLRGDLSNKILHGGMHGARGIKILLGEGGDCGEEAFNVTFDGKKGTFSTYATTSLGIKTMDKATTRSTKNDLCQNNQTSK